MSKPTKTSKPERILRQSKANRFVHWATALSIFLLLITGLGQLPLYTRYNVTKLPGAQWLGNYFITINLHYLAGIVLIFAATFHIVLALARKEFDIFPRRGDLKESYLIIRAMLTKGKEPPADKYLAEQRVAYFFIAFSILLLIVTGIIKIIKNLPGFDLPYTLLFWTTALHNIGTVLIFLGILGHFAAFLFKENRALLPGMFTGYVPRDYVNHRHVLWYRTLLQTGKIPPEDDIGKSVNSSNKETNISSPEIHTHPRQDTQSPSL